MNESEPGSNTSGTDLLPPRDRMGNSDYYVEGGDIKSYSAHSGESQPEAVTESEETAENPDEPEAVDLIKMQRQEQVRQTLEEPNRKLDELQLLILHSAMPAEAKNRFTVMRSMYEQEVADIRTSLMDYEEIDSDRISKVNENLANQIALAKSELATAKEAEEKRQAAEVVGRTHVAKYEARKATEAAQNIMNPRTDTLPMSTAAPRPGEAPVTPDKQAEAPKRKISERERKLARQYGQAARMTDALLAEYRQANPGDQAGIDSLKNDVQRYYDKADLTRYQEGKNPKPKLFGGMREVKHLIQQLDDAAVARRYINSAETPNKVDAKKLKRFKKMQAQHKNRFAKYVSRRS